MSPDRFASLCRFFLLSSAIISCLSCRPSPLFPTTTEASTTTESSRNEASTVTFLAVGDIMLSRGVARRIKAANDSLLPFRQLEPLLKSTDFNFGNLETPISGRDQVLGHKKIFNTRIEDIEGLTTYNFDVVNLANNHAFDQGPSGLKATRKFLEDRGITYLGAGDTLDEAWRAKVITANGLRIAFIGASYASVNDGGVTRHAYIARIEDLDYLKATISGVKAQADFIIVTMHAGTEHVAKADPRRPLDKWQIDFAHAAVDYGADLVIGAHPHWIQNLERYSGKYIFYSLGNFIFDMHDPINNQGLVLKITLRGAGRSTSSPTTNRQPPAESSARIELIECLPVIIENYSTPRLASEEEAQKILQRVNLPRRLSEP